MRESNVETNSAATGNDLVGRLMQRLLDEGFRPEQSMEDWQQFGEIIFRRTEKISIATGQTIVIFTRVPDVNGRLLRQTSDSVVNTYKAKSVMDKGLSVLQSTTIYHCLVCTSEQPYNEALASYVTRIGGATFIPVVLVPEINQVLYPMLEEKVGSILPRVEYLQYLLGERRDPVNMHRPTVHAFYVSVAVIAMLLLAVAFSWVM